MCFCLKINLYRRIMKTTSQTFSLRSESGSTLDKVVEEFKEFVSQLETARSTGHFLSSISYKIDVTVKKEETQVKPHRHLSGIKD